MANNKNPYTSSVSTRYFSLDRFQGDGKLEQEPDDLQEDYSGEREQGEAFFNSRQYSETLPSKKNQPRLIAWLNKIKGR